MLLFQWSAGVVADVISIVKRIMGSNVITVCTCGVRPMYNRS